MQLKLLNQQNRILISQQRLESLWNCKNVQANNAKDIHTKKGNDLKNLILI